MSSAMMAENSDSDAGGERGAQFNRHWGAMSTTDLDMPTASGSFSPRSAETFSTSCPGSPFSSTVSTSLSGLSVGRSSRSSHRQQRFKSVFRSVVNSMFPFSMMGPCRMLTMPSQREGLILGSRVTGTIFGHRRGHVHFAVQDDQRSLPTLILEFSIPTSTLVQDMASGLVRIALECEKLPNRGKLYQEPIWSMFCNGRKTGYAIRRLFSEFDRHILTLVQAVSMGAGVLPMDGENNGESSEGELMYMRGRFERVIGSRDSEAFYMMNPDGGCGGPELSIFLLRI